MSPRIALAVAILACTTAVAQPWCIQDPQPNNKCQTHGDPASIAGGFSWYSTTDIDIQTPVGRFTLDRMFFSSPVAWNQTLSSSLPRPFSGPLTNIEWWHSLHSAVIATSTGVIYNTGQTGNRQTFTINTSTGGGTLAGCMPPGACSWERQETSGLQLRSIPTGFVVVREDQATHFHEAKIVDSSSKASYLLSKIVTPAGATLADIAYGAPTGTINCPVSNPPSGQVAPYISTVTLAGGHQLIFKYSQTGGAGSPCPLARIDYLAPSSGTSIELVRYTLATSPVGRVTSALFRSGDAGAESYDYSNSGFAVVRQASNVFRHQYDGGGTQALVLSGYGNAPTTTVVSHQFFTPAASTYQPLTLSGTACNDSPSYNQGILLSTAMTGRAGDSGNSAATLSTTYQMSRLLNTSHERFRLRDSDSCGGSEACSPGENRYEPRGLPSIEGIGAGNACNTPEWVVSASKNKRNNWTLSPKVKVPILFADGGTLLDGGVASYHIALAGTQRGAYEDAGWVMSPLESESYTYLVKSGGRYAMETMTRPGGLSSSVVTTYTYADTNGGLLLTREVTAGSTLTSVATGGTGLRFRATFYRPKLNDPLQRIEVIEGPCWVSGLASTACDGPNPDGGTPYTRYEYYGSTANADSQRLSKTIRNAGTSGVQLVTEYIAYTPEGDPGKIRTYATGGGAGSEQVDTDFLYSGRRPISQKVYRSSTPGVYAETLWFYDEDRVTAVRYPEGNFEVMCYRDGAFPNLGCTGSLTKKLRWRAKASAFPLGTWSERIEYDYDPNTGYQVEERRFVAGEALPRLRKRTHPDLHGRATYTRSGDSTSATNFETKAHFDGSDNRDAFGPPANVPPDYCRGTGATDSPLCWWFRYDRADRLNRANAPGSPNPLSRSCFDYNSAGNITQVSTGDSSLNCDTSFNAPGTQTGSNSTSTALRYKWDDFGNIIEVTNTGADTNGSDPTRYLYDAQGNVIEKRTPAMATGDSQTFEYDGLGRLVRVTRAGATPIVLYTLEYDAAAAPPFASTREFLAGRLARRNDSYGSTWYGYDYLGNTLAEFRNRTSCNVSKGVYCRPHTSYTWDRNGNLKTITYPFGRVVTYVYGTGALLDRVASITSTVWLTNGTTANRTMVNGVAWEPYGGLRGYNARLNNGAFNRGVEYYLGTSVESSPGSCGTAFSGAPDGSGRTRGLFVSSATFSPQANAHVGIPYTFEQRYSWGEDQVSKQTTCLGTTAYEQTFAYDQMQRLTSESMVNFPAFAGESASETKVFDSRGNRIGGSRDGYGQLDQTFDTNAKDRLHQLCWWRGFLVGPTECFVGYNNYYTSTGALSFVEGLKPGSASPWNLSYSYPFTNALSDVYSVVTLNGSFVLSESYYDAFGRRRSVMGPFGDGKEFTYDLGHQLLVDQTYSTSVVAGVADEYIWLDRRPILAFRSNLSSAGAHSNDFIDVPDTAARACNSEHCGVFHLVSNLQGFVNLAMHDYDGKVASFQLPDADGTVNQARMNTFGGYGTAYAQRFNVPASFSKQARFRTSWTGAVPGYSGVTSFELGGTTVLMAGGIELGRTWSQWSPVTTGTTDVVWSTTCSGACSSASDMFEWRTWETGAAQFHTNLRFPGQYQDGPDWYENWNRYYDPTTGRYLSPEPLLAGPLLTQSGPTRASVPRLRSASAYFEPEALVLLEGLPRDQQDEIARVGADLVRRNPWLQRRRQVDGRRIPSFAYANGNPVYLADPDGLAPINPNSTPYKNCESACEKALGACAIAGALICASTGPGIPACFPSAGGACGSAYMGCIFRCAYKEKKRCDASPKDAYCG